MRLLRWGAGPAAALMVGALVGCGGGGKPAPDPTSTTEPPPVSVSLKMVDTYSRNTDGLVGVWVSTNGAHAASATVTVRFDVPAGKKVEVAREAKQNDADWDHWPSLKLSSSPGPTDGLDTLTGSYSIPLHGGDIWRFYLRPQYGPSTENESVPVHVSLTAGGRTLATDSHDAALAAITAVRSNAEKTSWTLHREGRWTELDYTLTNVSTRDVAPVNAGVEVNSCSQDDLQSCQAGGSLLEHFAIEKYDGGEWVSLPDSGGRARAVLSTTLKAGAATKARLRVAATAGLGKEVDRAEVLLVCTGMMAGAKRASFDSDVGDFTNR